MKKLNLIDLSQVLFSGSCILFCGAGISFNSGIPVVKNFLEYLLKLLGTEKKYIDEYLNLGYPFEATMEILSQFIDIKPILKIFAIVNPNLNHFLIANLIATGKIKIVITTNFDENIEEALDQLGCLKNMDYMISHNLNVVPKNLSSINKPIIIKLHGTISDPWSIVTEIQQVASASLTDEMKELFKRLYALDDWNSILYWGYSFSDHFDITPAFRFADKKNKDAYIIEHTNVEQFITQDIEQKDSLYKYKSAIKIKCNSNILFQKVYELLFNSYERVDVPAENWKPIIDAWFAQTMDNTGLNNPDILIMNLFLQSRQFVTGQHYVEKALKAKIPINNFLLQGEMLIKAAHLYHIEARQTNNRAHFDKAIELQNAAIEVMKKNNDPYNAAIYKGNLGGMLIRMERCTEAEPLLIESITYMQAVIERRKVGVDKVAPRHLCGYSFSLASCYRTEGRSLAFVKPFYDRAMELSKMFGYVEIQELCYFGLGLLYDTNNDLTTARINFERAFEIAKNMRFVDRCVESFIKLIINIYKE
ncbi:SIR2 family protein, partial [Parafilimonas sp.]|uniref:SIR2 family protein n=1 Tax=Parafilimonas sp. TaxID=1969739 RepID=UPI003F805F28